MKRLMVFVALFMSVSVGFSAPVTAQKPLKYMFVVSAQSGAIQSARNDGYVLKMRLSAMDQVTMYTERPRRVVKVISGQALTTIWKEGANSFQKDPPNAVLSATNLKPVILAVQSVRVTGDSIEYWLKPLDAKQRIRAGRQLRKVVLVIDYNCVLIGNCLTPYKQECQRTGDCPKVD
jgi:hypothetical protein